MKKNLTALGLLLLSHSIWACTCMDVKTLTMTQVDKYYAFIGIVKVLKAIPNQDISKYDVGIETIEQIKGQKRRLLTVDSYHPDFQKGPKIHSSCDILLREDKMYLVLGSLFEGEITIGECSVFDPLAVEEAQNYRTRSVHTFLDSLRAYYHTLPVPLKGTFKDYYDNGRLKSSTQYKAGLKHGKAIQYKHNGKVCLKERYVEGRLEGMLRKKNVRGACNIHYKHGQKWGKAVYYSTDGKVSKRELYRADSLVACKNYTEGKLVSSMRVDRKTGNRIIKEYEEGCLTDSPL